jgi:thymidylate kinase
MTRFVSFEGIDGVGKTTLAEAVASSLEIEVYLFFLLKISFDYLDGYLKLFCSETVFKN